MKIRASILLASLLIIPAPVLAQAWSLEDCPTDSNRLEAHSDYRQAVLDAPLDTPLYTPNPYPKTDAEVIENFASYHLLAHSDADLEDLRSRDRDFFLALKSGKLDFQVIHVTNWTPHRCGPQKNRELFHIIRMFDRTSQIEVARASVDDTGHVARLRLRPETGFASIPSLEAAADQIRNTVGLQAENLQYVATWGTFRCVEVSPCLAFREAGETYLAEPGGAVLQVSNDTPSYSAKHQLTLSRRGPILDAFRSEGRELVSIGGDTYRAAVPIEPPSQR